MSKKRRGGSRWRPRTRRRKIVEGNERNARKKFGEEDEEENEKEVTMNGSNMSLFMKNSSHEQIM